MLLMGAACLEKNKQTIDSMNVFPVPDGDTGTNMSMTMQRAIMELQGAKTDAIDELASALAMGALKGARGNSGVILSQIFRGFSRSLKGTKGEITAELLSKALTAGTEAAYKAVMKPKEGTMLTVARLVSESVSKAVADGAGTAEVIDLMLVSGEAALKKTPELLPVLKEAGVLDSGGMGLLTIYRGFKMAMDGEALGEDAAGLFDFGKEKEEAQSITLDDVNEIKFGYCTEFFVMRLNSSATEAEIDRFRDKLMKIGDSVVVVHDDGMIKVHVHSNDPGKVLQLAMRLGEIDRIKIENMREQNRQLAEQLKANEKEIAVVAVSAGEGIDVVFESLGVNSLIAGGQTMNPSIDVITQAIKKANARNVFVLPNNPNIILAAEQAASISERNVIVIPTKTIVQGISAMISFNPEGAVDENREAMNEAIENVRSGSVTFAVRDTQFEGKTIAMNDIIGIVEGRIEVVETAVDAAAEKLVDSMLETSGSDCIVSLYYGSDVTKEAAEALAAKLGEKYPDAEFAVQYGGQPLYYYYIAVE